MGEESNIEQRKSVLGLTGGLGTKANQCKIVLNTGFKFYTSWFSVIGTMTDKLSGLYNIVAFFY